MCSSECYHMGQVDYTQVVRVGILFLGQLDHQGCLCDHEMVNITTIGVVIILSVTYMGQVDYTMVVRIRPQR